MYHDNLYIIICINQYLLQFYDFDIFLPNLTDLALPRLLLTSPNLQKFQCASGTDSLGNIAKHCLHVCHTPTNTCSSWDGASTLQTLTQELIAVLLCDIVHINWQYFSLNILIHSPPPPHWGGWAVSWPPQYSLGRDIGTLLLLCLPRPGLEAASILVSTPHIKQQ